MNPLNLLWTTRFSLATSPFAVDATSQPPLPAPFWFIQFFKGLGFFLHQIPMHLWFVGTLLAVALGVYGCTHGKTFSHRFARQLPFLIALGINFGIVPLLFIQVAYPKAFYNATILIAWPWLFVIALLIPAYYGVYLYTTGKKQTPQACEYLLCQWKIPLAAGWVAAGCLTLISLIFATGFSVLVAGSDQWHHLWEATNVAGAVTGISLNLFSLAFWSRWLLTVGLALGTLGAWVTLDSCFFADSESDAYHDWSQRFALLLAVGQACIATLAGAIYVWTWHVSLGGLGWTIMLIGLAMLWIPLSLWAKFAITRWNTVRENLRNGVRYLNFPMQKVGKSQAIALIVSQLIVLLSHTIARQLLQNAQIENVYTGGVGSQPVDPQWSAIALFLVSFVGGTVAIVWMLYKILLVTLLQPVETNAETIVDSSTLDDDTEQSKTIENAEMTTYTEDENIGPKNDSN
ncbi:MAG: hypothetical protein PHE53_04040 [Thermoguttaceae bacterium]|nr:hypothetical protein [Thermoguttaceae bacterium]